VKDGSVKIVSIINLLKKATLKNMNEIEKFAKKHKIDYEKVEAFYLWAFYEGEAEAKEEIHDLQNQLMASNNAGEYERHKTTK
jgi:hypothetical protein